MDVKVLICRDYDICVLPSIIFQLDFHFFNWNFDNDISGLLMTKDRLESSMEPTPTIHLTGVLEGLGDDFVTKLIHDEFEVTIEKDQLVRISNKLELELTHLSAGLKAVRLADITPNDIVIHFSTNHKVSDLFVEIADLCPSILVTTGLNSQPKHLEFVDTIIDINDLIPSTNCKHFQSNNLDQMLQLCYLRDTGGFQSDLPARYWWLSQQDAVTGLVGLVKCSSLPKGVVPMCGRREWSLSDTFEQLSMLYQRTLAGASGQFSLNHLQPSPVIGAGVKPVADVVFGKRPDLTNLHEVMLESSDAGWRPMVPLRTALMYYLAAKLE